MSKSKLSYWKNHPGSAILRLLVWVAAFLTVAVMAFLVGFILIKGVGNLKPELFALEYNSDNASLMPALINTLIMMLVTIVFQVGIAIILAIMVDNIGRGSKFFRTVYFFPIVISATALGLLFNLIFLYNKGMMNQLMEKMGHTDLIDWKAKGIALITMMVPVMWQYVGFYFVILITGLNNISVDLYEVASIDGATRWQRIRYITIPLMRNVICTCVVLAVTGALKVFDLPWVMFPKGMPQGTTFLTGTYMYYQTMEAMNVDYGSAIAVVIVALGIITSKVVNTIFKEVDY